MWYLAKWDKPVANLTRYMEWLSEWVLVAKKLNFLADLITACLDGWLWETNWPTFALKIQRLLRDTRSHIPWLISTKYECKGIWRKCPLQIIFIRFTTTIYKKIPAETGDRSPTFNLYPPLSSSTPFYLPSNLKETIKNGKLFTIFKLKSLKSEISFFFSEKSSFLFNCVTSCRKYYTVLPIILYDEKQKQLYAPSKR